LRGLKRCLKANNVILMAFSQIALLLVVAATAGILAKTLRQPLIIGYLLAGIALSVFGFLSDVTVFSGMGQIGVTLLLFLVGIEMNLKELPSIGKVAFISGIGQIILTSIVGFLIASALGFGLLPAIYTAVALTFSSTIIIVKLLSERRDSGSLYGRISIGFLLVQDFVAILILMFLASLGDGSGSPLEFLFVGIKASVLIIATWAISKKLVPRLFSRFLASSQELLYIASIAWALGIAGFVAGPLGFTLEIGGFLAGIALSGLPEHLEIASRVRPLRDFFLTIFFLILGSKLVVGGLATVIWPSIIFSTFVLIGNPLIMLAILGFMGYRRRTSFMAGLTVAQISEFSLILMAMGLGLGHVTEQHVASIILVAVITMTVSTYLILGGDSVFERLRVFLKLFEKKNTKEGALLPSELIAGHVLLIGGDRTGKRVISLLQKLGAPFLVVDYNPRVFNELTADRVRVLFGDISDPEILELSNIIETKLIVSTINNLRANLNILEAVRRIEAKPKVILTAETRDESVKYYEGGADYVVLPQVVAGDHIRHILKTYGLGSTKITKMGKAHFNRLLKR